jgi:hypothetical protein
MPGSAAAPVRRSEGSKRDLSRASQPLGGDSLSQHSQFPPQLQYGAPSEPSSKDPQMPLRLRTIAACATSGGISRM